MIDTSGNIDYESVVAELHAKIDYVECKNKELIHRCKQYEERQEKAKLSLKRCWVYMAFCVVIFAAWYGGEILLYGCSQSSIIDTFFAALVANHLTNIWMEAPNA